MHIDLKPIPTGEHYGLPREPFNFDSVLTWTSALDEARRLESREIDTCHFLIAFLSTKATLGEDIQSIFGLINKSELELKNGLAYRALRSLGATHRHMRRHLLEIVGYGDKPHKITKLVGRIPLDERPLSARASLAAKRAVAWAQKLGATEIGDEHLLLAILDEPDEVVSDVLSGMNIDADKLRQATLELVKQSLTQ